MLLTDLRELKSFLDVDPNNTNEDKNLNFYVTTASSWIEEYLNRGDFSFAYRQEYYAGTGTQKLVLKHRPVLTSPEPAVIIGQDGPFGQNQSGGAGTVLAFGRDFALQVDEPVPVVSGIGKSKCGILIRLNGHWTKPFVRQRGYLTPFLGESAGSILVQYWAGYTVDDLPGQMRLAVNTLVANIRYLFPLGVTLTSESYEERSVSISNDQKNWFMGLIKPMLLPYRNFKFG